MSHLLISASDRGRTRQPLLRAASRGRGSVPSRPRGLSHTGDLAVPPPRPLRRESPARQRRPQPRQGRDSGARPPGRPRGALALPGSPDTPAAARGAADSPGPAPSGLAGAARSGPATRGIQHKPLRHLQVFLGQEDSETPPLRSGSLPRRGDPCLPAQPSPPALGDAESGPPAPRQGGSAASGARSGQRFPTAASSSARGCNASARAGSLRPRLLSRSIRADRPRPPPAGAAASPRCTYPAGLQGEPAAPLPPLCRRRRSCRRLPSRGPAPQPPPPTPRSVSSAAAAWPRRPSRAGPCPPPRPAAPPPPTRRLLPPSLGALRGRRRQHGRSPGRGSAQPLQAAPAAPHKPLGLRPLLIQSQKEKMALDYPRK